MSHATLHELGEQAIALLQALIAQPSFSREEAATAAILAAHLQEAGFTPQRHGNNVWATSPYWGDSQPTLLLLSHHDTVRPGTSWQRQPFEPTIEHGKLYGLGSNDAGGPLVAMLAAFVHAVQQHVPVNLVLLAAAEEEISGKGGVEAVLPHLPAIDAALVGEPTELHAATAERGLLVIDAHVLGKTGHAARNEGENALYKALPIIQGLQQHTFSRTSPTLGAVKLSVTQIQAGSQHNVVPDRCSFVIDVRLPEAYTPEEILQELTRHYPAAHFEPRSLRLRPSFIEHTHKLVQACKALGISAFGSPTLSDMALLPMPAIKIGPGSSARSHTPDEYIGLDEIHAGIRTYSALITQFSSLWPPNSGSNSPAPSTLR